MTTEVDNIIFYRSFYESLSNFGEDTRIKLYDAIFKFAFDGEETEFSGMPKAIFGLIKPLITANIKNQKRGKKGGRPTEANYDEELIEEITEEYKNVFGEKIISKSNKEKIAKITDDNNLEIEDWKKIFKNASRGWNYPDGKHVDVSLKKIIEDWDSFHRGDNGLAPDAEIIAQKKADRAKQEKAKKELDTSLDTEFFVYDEYRGARYTEKLQAQKIYTEQQESGASDETALKEMLIYLREVENEKEDTEKCWGIR